MQFIDLISPEYLFPASDYFSASGLHETKTSDGFTQGIVLIRIEFYFNCFAQYLH